MKQIHSSECLGPDLIELRERAGLSVEEAAKKTKLPPSFLLSLEEERWTDIDDLIYSERLLRLYVSYLGGNESYYLHKYRACLRARNIVANPEDFLPRPVKLRMKDLLVAPRLIAAAGFFIFSLLLGGYVYGQARAIRKAPTLEIFAPVEGLNISEPEIIVLGKTIPEATVTINGNQAVVRPDGSFEEHIYVSRGMTELNIRARKRHGNEVTETRHIFYERELPTY